MADIPGGSMKKVSIQQDCISHRKIAMAELSPGKDSVEETLAFLIVAIILYTCKGTL